MATVCESHIPHCAQVLSADPLQTLKSLKWDVVLGPGISSAQVADRHNYKSPKGNTVFYTQFSGLRCSSEALNLWKMHATNITSQQLVQNMIQMAVVPANWKVQMELWYFKNLNFILWKSVLTLTKSLEICQVRSLSQQSEMGTAERPRSKICMRWSDALTTHLDGDSHSKLTSQDFRAKSALGEDSCFRLNTDDFTGIFRSAAVRSFLRNVLRNLK